MPGGLTLRWTGEDGGEQQRELAAGTLTLGRDPESDIVLTSPMVSRAHARVVVDESGHARLEDISSRNGTFLHGEKIESAELRAGDELTIGGVSLFVVGPGTRPAGLETVVSFDLNEELRRASGATSLLANATVVVAPHTEAPPEGAVPERLLTPLLISERALRDAGVEVRTVEVAALGAGIGSFVLADLLRCSGMAAADIAVLGVEQFPMARYARLCDNSQIPLHERIRSNSESTPDNVWGFPGYAVREGVRELRSGHFKTAVSCLWSVFGEPAVAQTYTPKLQQVFSSIEHEVERIGYPAMLLSGRIRHIRKSEEGRLVAIVSQSDADRRRHIAVSARAMHLSIGYPAVQLLPDLAEYREKHEEFERVVNAYEPHNHIYAQLRERGGVVLLRGRGIVASRVLQRLFEERKVNPKIQVIHLHRSRLAEGHRYGRTRRKVEEQHEFQPFNWPKSCWGGEYLDQLEGSTDLERKALLDVLGGTSTASRGDWRKIVRTGVHDGWYRPEFGTVKSVEPAANNRVGTRIASTLGGGGEITLDADFVIDCTGLVASASRSPLLADLLQHYQVPLNSLGRLAVTNSYEIAAMRHGESRMYAAGALTLGGPMAAVDSFLGLQFCAMRAVDAMQDMHLRGLKRLNGLRSVSQWWKWVRKAAP